MDFKSRTRDFQLKIRQKFNENFFRGKRDIEGTRIARVKLVTFNCDLDLSGHNRV